MLENIKLFGGIAGLVSATFLVWDRWTRGRPLAWVTATKRFSGNPEEYLRVINPGHSDLFIRAVRVYPRTARVFYGVAKDHSTRAITSTLYKTDVNVLLRPGKDHSLPIIKLPTTSGSPPKAPWVVCFLIYWRKTSSTWLLQLPAVVMTTTRYIERISAAATREDDAP
jgi:hypothetical protein